MAYKVGYDSETVRVKVLYSNKHTIDKVKIRMNSGYATREDVIGALKFLEKQGFKLNKRHKGRLTLEKLEHYRGHVGDVILPNGASFIFVDSHSANELSIDNIGIVDEAFYTNETINYMVDFLVAFHYFNHPHEYKGILPPGK